MTDVGREGNNFHLHNVTDFVTSDISSFDSLQGNEHESGIKYLSSIAQALEKTKLMPTESEGTYLRIYHPLDNQDKPLPIAIKVIDTKVILRTFEELLVKK
ncbi:hypothetical protein HY407_00975 [Candidatus Gottesmanbacteria bacterium]|nr:hypothetical protein [Candidatus Gottesmanbacteria bacterium]